VLRLLHSGHCPDCPQHARALVADKKLGHSRVTRHCPSVRRGDRSSLLTLEETAKAAELLGDAVALSPNASEPAPVAWELLPRAPVAVLALKLPLALVLPTTTLPPPVAVFALLLPLALVKLTRWQPSNQL
jgi:hypothetical protein